MSKKKSKRRKRKTGKSPDPYLRAFLRQGAAIIAAERGFNDTSNAKLQAVAEQIGLSNEAFASAIQQLKQPDNDTGLVRYERKFLEYIDRELGKIQGNVLTIRAEGKLVDLAAEKYQIKTVRALQLIQKAAEKNQVGTISHSDAEQFSRQLVVDAAAGKSELATDEIERLYHICNKWGFEEFKVDRLLNSIFVANKWNRRKSQMLIASTFIIAIGIVAGVSYGLAFIEWDRFFKSSVLPSNQSSNTVKSFASSTVATPNWWDDRLNRLAESYSQNRSNHNSLLVELFNSENRETVYRKLVDESVSRYAPDLQRLMANIYFAEPQDSNARSILKTTKTWIDFSTLDQPATNSRIRKAQTAADLLAEIATTGRLIQKNNDVQYDRSRYVSEFIASFCKQEVQPDLSVDTIDDLRKSVYFDQWNHAVKFSMNQPARVASTLATLERFQESANTPEINALRNRTVNILLEASPHQWKSIKTSIEAAIANTNDAQTIRWIEFWEKSDDAPFALFLTDVLASRIHVNPTNASPFSKHQMIVRYRARHSIANFDVLVRNRPRIVEKMEIANRMARRLKIIDGNPFPPVDELQLPNAIAQFAQLNNLLLAWTYSFHNKLDVTELEQIANPDFIEILNPAVLANRQPTPSEKRRLDKAFDKIFSSNPAETSARISALSQIQNIANRFSDIAPKRADRFIDYIFTPRETREELALDRTLPDIAHWTNLKLAFADRISGRNDSIDSVLDKLSRLEVEVTQLNSIPNWRIQIQKAIWKNCITKETAKIRSRTGPSGWNDLQQNMESLLLRRLEVIGTRTGLIANQPFPENWMDGVENWFASQENIVDARTTAYLSDHFPRTEQLVASTHIFERQLKRSQFGRSLAFPEKSGSEMTTNVRPLLLTSNKFNLGQQWLRTEFELNRILVQIFNEQSSHLEY